MSTLINITIGSLIMVLFNSCAVHYENKFLTKYEFENFSQYNGIDMSFRGSNKDGNFVIYGYAPDLKNYTSKAGYFVITLDKQNYQAIETKWTLTENNVNADTIKLQQLAQTFMKYEIPRLNVDTAGNVFVYLANVETLAFVQFINESELLKRSKETKWIKVKNNWYKLK
jgi:hypothetical protein